MLAVKSVAKSFLFATLLSSSLALAKTTHHVTIENVKFGTDVLTVHAGDEIVWTNKDIVPHTVTAIVTKGKPPFDSGQIDPGKEFKLKVKGLKGEVPYKCLFHPNMLAKLIVE